MRNAVAVLLLVAVAISLCPAPAEARQNEVVYVLQSSFYGGLTGTLIGGAILAFRDKPSDHLSDLRIGAGVGVILGAIYGIAKTTSRSFAEIENGKVTFQIPTLQWDIDQYDRSVRGSVDLLRIPFQ